MREKKPTKNNVTQHIIVTSFCRLWLQQCSLQCNSRCT